LDKKKESSNCLWKGEGGEKSSPYREGGKNEPVFVLLERDYIAIAVEKKAAFRKYGGGGSLFKLLWRKGGIPS